VGIATTTVIPNVAWIAGPDRSTAAERPLKQRRLREVLMNPTNEIDFEKHDNTCINCGKPAKYVLCDACHEGAKNLVLDQSK
jgi:hypothetical protein